MRGGWLGKMKGGRNEEPRPSIYIAADIIPEAAARRPHAAKIVKGKGLLMTSIVMKMKRCERFGEDRDKGVEGFHRRFGTAGMSPLSMRPTLQTTPGFQSYNTSMGS